MTVEKILVEGSELLGIKLNEIQKKSFVEFLKLLKKWNKRVNLTSVTDDKDIVIKHFLDSLSISNLIPDGSFVLDIGSGAGFPGIPLSIVNTSLKITLLDSTEKKVFFTREVIRKLELQNVETLVGRAEDLNNGIKRGVYDFVITRALGGIKKILELGFPYLKSDGKFLLMRGKNGLGEWNIVKDELDGKIELIEVKNQTLPFSDYKRVVLVVGCK